MRQQGTREGDDSALRLIGCSFALEKLLADDVGVAGVVGVFGEALEVKETYGGCAASRSVIRSSKFERPQAFA